MADPVVVVDDRFVISGANPAAGRLFGTAPEEMLGRLSLEWVHEPDRIEAAERLAVLLDGRPTRPATLRLVGPDGRLSWVEVAGARLGLDGGDTRLVLSIRDVGWRLARELESARSVSRSHVLSQLAVDFQSVMPGQLTEVLASALQEVGAAVGALLTELHEVEPDGTTLVLRGRWATPDVGAVSRAIAAAHVTVSDVPRWSSALGNGADLVEVSEDDDRLRAELEAIDPALAVGISVPLRPAERLIGVLTFGWERGHVLTNDERDLAASAGRVFGTALDRVRAHQALLESEAMFRDLFHANSAVMYLIDPATLRLVDANAAATRFYGYTRDEMVGMELHELTVHSRADLHARVEAVRADRSTTVVDERQVRADGSVRSVEVHSTPMRIGNRELDLAIIQDVTEQRIAHENLERLASTDDLTGALNRRRFLELLREEIARAERYGRPLSLLMLDLDHFKSVNDARGHAAGDAVLVHFSDAACRHLRSNDRFARLGGEEFAVLLPETDLGESLEIAERVRVDAATAEVTVSIGAAEWAPGTSLEAFYAQADKMLYEAKQAGRNRVAG